MNKINLIGMVSIFSILIGSVAVNASGFLPPALMTMTNSSSMTNWSSSYTIPNVTGYANSIVPNATITTTIPQVVIPKIIKTLDYKNGQTFGFIATNDPTGLGVRSNMNYLCTMYSFLFGIMQYFQTNSYTC